MVTYDCAMQHFLAVCSDLRDQCSMSAGSMCPMSVTQEAYTHLEASSSSVSLQGVLVVHHAADACRRQDWSSSHRRLHQHFCQVPVRDWQWYLAGCTERCPDGNGRQHYARCAALARQPHLQQPVQGEGKQPHAVCGYCMVVLLSLGNPTCDWQGA